MHKYLLLLLLVGCKSEVKTCTNDVCSKTAYFNGRLSCVEWKTVESKCTVYKLWFVK
jgi:hypothetical protein